VTLVKEGSAQLNLTGLNPYSGGTIVKGGALAVGSGGQVGTGGIILSNGTTFNMSANTPSVFPGNTITIAAGGTAAFASANAANGIGGNIVSGDANSTNSIVGPISIGSATVKQYQGFTGTVQVEITGGIRFSSTGLNINGGDNTTFINLGTINTRNGTAGADNGVYLGALFGNGILSAGGSAAGTSTYIIGSKNIDSTFSGQVTGSGDNNTIIVKSGTGTLTLDGTLSYERGTVVSNGVLSIAGTASLDTCTNIVVRAGAILDVSTAGVLGLGNATSQRLGGSGTVRGSVTASGGGVATINPGDAIGTLTITNDLTLAANTVVNMELNRTNAQTADRINANSYTSGGATVLVTNLGPTLVTGDTFQLFGGAVSGLTVTLPASNVDNTISYAWTNMIAINGSIKVLTGASAVNPNPTNITSTVTGGGTTLTLSWPSSHTGWTLQNQTNSLNVGITGTWFDVAGSTTTNQVIVPIVPGNPTVFYRLKL
jgi:autotransporter-associated beta strand protein